MRTILAIVLIIFSVHLNYCHAELNCESRQSIQITTQDDSFALEVSNLKPGFQAKEGNDITAIPPCKSAAPQPQNTLDVFSTIFAAMKQKANAHNHLLYQEIIGNFEKNAVQGRSDLKAEEEFNKFFDNLKQEAIDEFDRRKLGDDEITSTFHQKLVDDIDELESNLKNANDATSLFALLAIVGIAAAAG